MKKDCKHKLDWDKVWLPAKIYLKDQGFRPEGRVLPISKYWRGNCVKCGKEISEEELPYESTTPDKKLSKAE